MLPDIQIKDGIRKVTQTQFGGYDRRPDAADWTLYETKRMSTGKAPLLSNRCKFTRRLAGQDAQFLACGGDALLEFCHDGRSINYDGWYLCSLDAIGQDPHNEKRILANFGKAIVIWPDKVLLNLRHPLLGVVETVDELEDIEDPQEGDAWAVQLDDEDNPTVYFYQDGAWLADGKVLQALEAAVTIPAEYAIFGNQVKAYEGGWATETIAEMNTIQNGAGSPADFTDYFKAGDAVKISGCNAQPENNQTLIVRAVEPQALHFYENSFRRAKVCYAEVTATLPEKRTGTNYKTWYKATGEYWQEDVCFTLPDGFDAVEGDVLVTAPVEGQSSSGNYYGLWLIQSWHGNRAIACTLSHGDDRPTGTDPAQTTPELVSFALGEDEWRGVTEQKAITIEKRLPDMDFIFGNDNRLWGCKGSTIYASKLGDPSNFYFFDGTAEDSWSVDVHSEGSFTGAISYDGYPTFYKKMHRYKIYGNEPAAFALSETSCDGVLEGSAASMAIVGGALLYLSEHGVMIDTGAQPSCVSRQLGEAVLRNGVAGANGHNYWISMQADGVWQSFVYDLDHNVWLRDEARQYLSFATVGDLLYGLSYVEEDGLALRYVVRFSPENDDVWAWENETHSEVITNDFVMQELNRKLVHRLQLRLSVGYRHTVLIQIRYDGGDWLDVKGILGRIRDQQQSYYLPVPLRRCDRFALRIAASGDWTLHAMALETKRGSAIH